MLVGAQPPEPLLDRIACSLERFLPLALFPLTALHPGVLQSRCTNPQAADSDKCPDPPSQAQVA